MGLNLADGGDGAVTAWVESSDHPDWARGSEGDVNKGAHGVASSGLQWFTLQYFPQSWQVCSVQ